MAPKLFARPPLWARWAGSLTVGVVCLVALIIFVHHNSNNSLAHISAKASQKEDEQAQVVVGQDQAPHAVTMAAGQSGQIALTTAVRGYMRHQIAIGVINGPLASVACHQTGARSGRLGFSCSAVASHVRYPFLATATPSSHAAVFCKRDAPPVPSENIPVSPRCRLT